MQIDRDDITTTPCPGRNAPPHQESHPTFQLVGNLIGQLDPILHRSKTTSSTPVAPVPTNRPETRRRLLLRQLRGLPKEVASHLNPILLGRRTTVETDPNISTALLMTFTGAHGTHHPRPGTKKPDTKRTLLLTNRPRQTPTLEGTERRFQLFALDGPLPQRLELSNRHLYRKTHVQVKMRTTRRLEFLHPNALQTAPVPTPRPRKDLPMTLELLRPSTSTALPNPPLPVTRISQRNKDRTITEPLPRQRTERPPHRAPLPRRPLSNPAGFAISAQV